MDNLNKMEVIDDEQLAERKSGRIALLVVCIALPLCVGFLSAYITSDNMLLFDEIIKPMLTPPRVAFPIAWTILYIFMGIASYLALSKCADWSHGMNILFPYMFQLLLNFLWSIIFFNGRLYGVAFICLVFMWVAIFRTMVHFGAVNKLTYIFMIPYLCWVTFAGYLNLSIYLLNK